MPKVYRFAVAVPLLFLSALAFAHLGPMSKDGEPDEPVATLPSPAHESAAVVELGRTLFHSPQLSRDGSRSCVSCHDLKTNGANALKLGVALTGAPLPHNVPSVFNAALNFRFNWEGNARTLQDQASKLLQDPRLMNETWDDLAGKLGRDPNISRQFRDAFDRPPDRKGILDAIAAFEQTLITPDSRFDLWLSGDETALTQTEKDGYNLFKSAGCVACHQGRNFGGNLFQKVGVFQPLLEDQPAKQIRVPSLRNVAVTAPYFDDGSAATLSEAVDRMADAQLGRHLTEPQIKSIVAFLQTLTGRFDGRPVTQARQ